MQPDAPSVRSLTTLRRFAFITSSMVVADFLYQLISSHDWIRAFDRGFHQTYAVGLTFLWLRMEEVLGG